MMNTQTYLNTIAPKQSFHSTADISTLEKWAKRIHDSPKLVTITRIALDALSVAALIAVPMVWGIGGIILGCVGLAGLLATEFVHRTLSGYGILATPIGTHAFKEAKVEGGRLYHQGKVPILELDMSDPYKAGKAQGTLLAEEILMLNHRMNQVAGLPSPQDSGVPENLDQLKKLLPQEYLQEMQGLVDGVNNWIHAHPFSRSFKKVSLDELFLSQLMPDSLYYNPGHKSPSTENHLTTVACTVVIDQNDKSGLVFGRNMDWPSFGLSGKYSLLINRKGKETSTVEVGLPGMIGTLTGMNSHGLSIAMNVCAAGIAREGIPACFYNRMVLERCKNVAETKTFVDRYSPLGSYHLSVADPKTAQSYHFYQGDQKQHVIRKLKENQPLIITNCTYGAPEKERWHMHCSLERRFYLDSLFNHAATHVERKEQDLEALVAHSLTLPYVNNVITTHAVEMVPHKRLMRVSFDNSFAASHPLQEVDATHLLG